MKKLKSKTQVASRLFTFVHRGRDGGENGLWPLARRLWPDSLFGQLVLTMLLGAALLQGVNIYAVCFIQHSYNREVLQVRYDYNSSIFLALQQMEPYQRDIFLDGLSKSQAALSQPFQFVITQNEPRWQSRQSDVANRTEVEMGRALEAASAGESIPIQARVLAKNDPDAAHPFYKDSNFPLVQMAIRMDAGHWLKITQPLYMINNRAVWAQRGFLLLESILFSLLVIWLIRRATLPISQLGKAAEIFGRHPESTGPLKEFGSQEVRETFQSFNKMREKICSHLAERNNMLEAMGHDLRTPLARIQLRLEKVQPESLKSKLDANVEEIRSIVVQGLELARSLQTSEKAVALDAVAFTQSVVDDIRDQGRQVFLSDRPDNPGRKILIKARPTCLKRCLENLMTNAVNYGGEAEVAVNWRRDEKIIIEVKDRGPGIPEDLLEKVFEPYYRLERSRNRDSGGIGLGLSIARNMINLDGGELSLMNRPEGGLLARIILPTVSHAR